MKFTRLFLAIGSAFTMVSLPVAAQYTATNFSGAAKIPFDLAKQQISLAAGTTSVAIQQAARDTAATIATTSNESNSAMLSANLKSSIDQVQLAQTSAKLQMGYEAELVANEIASQRAMRPGETKEEIEWVLNYLKTDEIRSKNLAEVLMHAQSLDGIAKVVVQPKADVNDTCKKEEGCGTEKTINPSKIIAFYAEMCTADKSKRVQHEREKQAKVNTDAQSATVFKKAIASDNSQSALSKSLKAQRELSCTPEMVKLGACGSVEKSTYIEKMLKNEIIPNGNTSAINLLTPSSVGGAGYVSLDTQSQKKMADAIAFDALEKSDGGKIGAPDVVYTYRNSTQLKNATFFRDNIINMAAVSNQGVSDRTNPRSADFQARYMSRAASLDLAQSVFNDSIAERTGKKLSRVNLSNLKEGEIIKESDIGAGSLDIANHNIAKGRELVSPENISKLNDMTMKTLLDRMYEVRVEQNEQSFDELLILEKQLLLVSNMLAAEINSPENIEYMKTVR
ncbi:TPA: hypothetical protein I7730_16365 [Vibrio vulnificus]|uniref:Uncharacterized protein n=1 Tax=Vibrio vulnificus TaxID=672 RepID=A0A8H9TGB8_VIBVL|nr:hypothetical protein [Vibrio vulnificus]HAS8541359.1 hypothetical protein [Vibrio vulnificus]